MGTRASGSTSLKDYLKRYETSADVEKKKKKKRKTKPEATGVLVVDEDPVWQKPVRLDEDDENDSPDEKPLVDEDIEVKRMKRLEQLKARRPYHAISEDGSGWVPISDVPKCSSSLDPNSDISPPRKQNTRYDTPSPEHGPNALSISKDVNDLLPLKKSHGHYDSPLEKNPSSYGEENSDLSPPRQSHMHNDSPSLLAELKSSEFGRHATDLNPPRQRRRRYYSPSPDPEKRPYGSGEDMDLSPPRPHSRRCDSHSPIAKQRCCDTGREAADLSPPRQHRRRHISPSSGQPAANPSRESQGDVMISDSVDISPPRRSRKDSERLGKSNSQGFSSLQSRRQSSENDKAHFTMASDLSPPRKTKEKSKTGLVTGQDIKEEITKTKQDDWTRFEQMDPSISGRGAKPVYRDKKTGQRISEDEYLKSKKKEEKPKEVKKVEWGSGLAQKREAEQKLKQMAAEKEMPFAQYRDDPRLDEMLKERTRWGDPMAHLVKKKQPQFALQDLGNSEMMKESGFIIPQEIPSHSWIKRGFDAPPNRYGIKPGRHWDGVDRSNGFEKEIFKRMNDKQARETEAYLWSVSDM